MISHYLSVKQLSDFATSFNKTIAFVCPWFGPDIPGGAERAIRELAENCSRRGLRTVILTTCARDFYNWTDFHPVGTSEWRGISILRFPCNPRNVADFDRINSLLLQNRPISSFEEKIFLTNIISSDSLTQFIWKNREHYRYIFSPYMFGTTYWPLTLVAPESYCIPCLHDESYIYLPRFQKMLSSVKKLLFYSDGEKKLAEATLGRAAADTVIGLGIEIRERPSQADMQRFRKKYNLDSPFVFLPGRKQPEKNTDLTIEYYSVYDEESERHLKLVLAGPGSVAIPDKMNDRIRDIGFIGSEDLASAYACAEAVVIPSERESFSFTMFEAWSYKKPVIVHESCLVTALPVKKHEAGMTFRSARSFGDALQRVVKMSSEELLTMGDRGNRLIQEEYSWDCVIQRLTEAIGEQV